MLLSLLEYANTVLPCAHIYGQTLQILSQNSSHMRNTEFD